MPALKSKKISASPALSAVKAFSLPSISPSVRRAFHTGLVAWFLKHQRDLPWRKANGRDPYAVAVSEFMLQQTQVATVIPYFERWMKTFPTWKSLANAPEDRVLKQWEGLGYYRRARNLQALARAVMEKHAGELPADVGQLRALPGIGPYTAGAIASFAFGISAPLVDGNVQRVFARVFDLNWDLAKPAVQKAFWELAGQLVPRSGERPVLSRQPGMASPNGPGNPKATRPAFYDPQTVASRTWQTACEKTATGNPQLSINPSLYNEGLMELGATVCLPRNPLCPLCPLKKVCRGKDHAEELPAKTRTRTVKETEQRALIKRHNSIWLLNPDAPGRWHGFYRLPPFDPQTMEKGKALGILRYTITHHRVAAEVLAAAWKTQAPPKGAWLSPQEIKSIALPSPHRKMLSLLPP